MGFNFYLIKVARRHHTPFKRIRYRLAASTLPQPRLSLFILPFAASATTLVPSTVLLHCALTEGAGKYANAHTRGAHEAAGSTGAAATASIEAPAPIRLP